MRSLYVRTIGSWQVSVKDVKDRQNRLAKLRSLLFQHEIKAKRIKKIKSKTYRRLLRKDKSKEASAFDDFDSEAVRELRIKQEFKRAEVIIFLLKPAFCFLFALGAIVIILKMILFICL